MMKTIFLNSKKFVYTVAMIPLTDFNQDVQFARQDLPSFEDLTGAAIALMRLQDTYHLDTSKVAHGNLGGVMSTSLSGFCRL